MNRLYALALAMLLAGCAARPPSPEAFAFAIVGDTPYSEREEESWLAMIGRINREPLDFVIHVGDFKGGERCSDEIYARRLAQFNTFAHPLVYTPGDNEWTDCRRPHMGSMDPLERLGRIRQVFFTDRQSLGTRRIALQAQDTCMQPPVSNCGCGAYPENRAWQRNGVHFVTLNVPGSHNNVGFDAASDAEAVCRDAANSRWLQQAFAAAQGARALVIAVQANPWDTKRPVYRDFVAQVEAGAVRLGKPVLFVHGDTHTYRVDFPFSSGPITRVETFGSPFVGWVKVTVDPADPRVFTFAPHLQAMVTHQ